MIGGEACEIKNVSATQIICKAPKKSSQLTTAAILYVNGIVSPNLCECADGAQVILDTADPYMLWSVHVLGHVRSPIAT